jgi:hypothetical protein
MLTNSPWIVTFWALLFFAVAIGFFDLSRTSQSTAVSHSTIISQY